MVNLKFFSSRLFGVDLGSSQLRIYDPRADQILEQPSYIAFRPEDKKIIGVGKDAFDLLGRAEQKIKVQNIVQAGRIYDYDLAYTMLRIVLQPLLKQSMLSPDVMVSCPVAATTLKKQAIVKLFTSLGCGKVYLISEPLAASIGAGVPIADASGAAIFHLGADLLQGSVISLGTGLAAVEGNQAGNYADRLIQVGIAEQDDLLLSMKTAEQVKQQVGLTGLDYERSFLVAGKQVQDNSPQEITIKTSVISQQLMPVVEKSVSLLQDLLSQIPPDLTVDVIDKGVLLSGGLAQLAGLASYLTQRLGVSCSVTDDPDQVVIKGIANALEHLDEFKKSLGYNEQN